MLQKLKYNPLHLESRRREIFCVAFCLS